MLLSRYLLWGISAALLLKKKSQIQGVLTSFKNSLWRGRCALPEIFTYIKSSECRMLHLTKMKADYRLKASGSTSTRLDAICAKCFQSKSWLTSRGNLINGTKMTKIVEEKYQKLQWGSGQVRCLKPGKNAKEINTNKILKCIFCLMSPYLVSEHLLFYSYTVQVRSMELYRYILFPSVPADGTAVVQNPKTYINIKRGLRVGHQRMLKILKLSK